MSTIDKQVRDLAKLEKSLRGMKIVVAARKDGTIKVKWGKKFDMLTVPSREWGNIIKDEFEAVIVKKANMVQEVIKHIQGRVEQLSLELFGKGDGDGCQEGTKAVGTHILGGDREDNTGPGSAEKDV